MKAARSTGRRQFPSIKRTGSIRKQFQTVSGYTIMYTYRSELSMDTPLQLSQALSSLSQDLSSNEPRNERELFEALVEEIEILRRKSHELYKKFNCSNYNEPVQTESSSGKYIDILSEKLSFIKHLTEAVSSSTPIGHLKGKLDMYREFASVLQQSFNEGTTVQQHLQEEINTLKDRIEVLDKQIETFSNLLQNSEEESAASQQMNKQLKETRDDMKTVLARLYPEEIFVEMTYVMQTISVAYLDNKENEEAQYVEVPPKSWHNKALLCLLQANIIVCHPKNPLKWRLLSDD